MLDTFAQDCFVEQYDEYGVLTEFYFDYEKFAERVVSECIREIETYQVPVGNSAAGELACEWTMGALEHIRDNIKETFRIDHETSAGQ